MKYFRRYEADGRCTVICLFCFATLGRAGSQSAAAELEQLHICGEGGALARAVRGESLRHCRTGIARALQELRRGEAALLVLASILLLYAFPTVVELALRPYVNPWIGIIGFGDVLGCLCLSLVFGRHRTALLLYLGLTVSEALIFGSGETTRHVLVWVVDLVPAMIVASCFARMGLHAPRRGCRPGAL